MAEHKLLHPDYKYNGKSRNLKEGSVAAQPCGPFGDPLVSTHEMLLTILADVHLVSGLGVLGKRASQYAHHDAERAPHLIPTSRCLPEVGDPSSGKGKPGIDTAGADVSSELDPPGSTACTTCRHSRVGATLASALCCTLFL